MAVSDRSYGFVMWDRCGVAVADEGGIFRFFVVFSVLGLDKPVSDMV